MRLRDVDENKVNLEGALIFTMNKQIKSVVAIQKIVVSICIFISVAIIGCDSSILLDKIKEKEKG